MLGRIFPLILAILHRILSLYIVFSPITTATSCQDADFFPGKCMYLCIFVCTYVCVYVCNVSMYILQGVPKKFFLQVFLISTKKGLKRKPRR